MAANGAVRFWALAALAAAVAASGTGCTTSMRKTTPFYKGKESGIASKAGQAKSEGERAADRVNVWPLAYWRRPVGSVLWPVLTFSEDHFALFPLYSQFRQDGGSGKWDEFNVLWPLAQFDAKGKDYRVFPVFWGRDRKGKGYQAVFPLYWNGDGSNALLPLWYVGPDTVWTPLVGWSGKPDNRSWFALGGLAGVGKTSRDGSLRKESWLVPVFGREKEWHVDAAGRKTPASSHFDAALGLLAGYDWNAAAGEPRPRPEQTDFLLLAGLAKWKWRDGTNVYWRAWPLAGRGRHADFAERWGWMDAETLPAGLRPIAPERRAELVARAEAVRSEEKQPAWADEERSRLWMGTNWVEVSELPGYGWRRKDERWWLLALAWRKAYVGGHWVDGEGKWARWDGETEAQRYLLEGEREWGNLLVAKGRVERRATFDAASGAKTGDERRSGGHVLGLLYRWSGKQGVAGEPDWARRRVLWKLWDWERTGGNVSLDVFPGVTWDSREDGYRKAAWLWRAFRWERTADGKTSVDVLFIPVWRGGGK